MPGCKTKKRNEKKKNSYFLIYYLLCRNHNFFQYFNVQKFILNNKVLFTIKYLWLFIENISQYTLK